MSGGWWTIIAMVGVLIFTVCVAGYFSLDERLAGWWVARARRLGRATGPFSFGLSVAVMVCCSILLVIGMVVTDRLGHWAWALCFMLPQTLVYTPFMLITLPARTGYGAWRDDLRDAGASPRQQRQIAWWAGPPSMVGMMIVLAIWMSMFVV